MWTSLTELRDVLGSRRFRSATIRLTILASVEVMVLLAVMSAMIVVLPLAFVVGLALHLYGRCALRQAAAHA